MPDPSVPAASPGPSPGRSPGGLPDRVRALLDDLDGAAGAAIGDAAALLLAAIEADGIVHVAGAGHSLAMVCETFYRAGGLAAVRPVFDPGVFPLDDAVRSTRVERERGVGRAVAAEAARARRTWRWCSPPAAATRTRWRWPGSARHGTSR
ncbi:SIS domain-containing protein [Actinomadura sp. CNU-125]|uniref:SIS domain-containing protein n=1 Tax=Actinomadura sp. CNU-125 TaxID=1904961 RepID=UPI000AF7DE15|nr:SIS domain-containing protein [Actinomadura sp. CNU-125]